MVTQADHTDRTAFPAPAQDREVKTTDSKLGKKDSQLILRMNKAERDAFVAL